MGGKIGADTTRIVGYGKPEHMRFLARFGSGTQSEVVRVALEFLERETKAAGITTKDINRLREELGL